MSQDPVQTGLRTSGAVAAINLVLAFIKVTTGIFGKSYALVADGIESMADVLGSLVVWGGLRVASRPPDDSHPYGHGKAESLAAVVVALFILVAAVVIATHSIHEIQTPHEVPAWYTLVVLVGVIVIKEGLFRWEKRAGADLGSRALETDAWHHRADAITSAAAFIGISIALFGGDRFAPADDWAALIACVVISANGLRLLRGAVDEVMDAAADPEVEREVRQVAESVEGVIEVEKCRIRKSGLGLLMDLHVVVDGRVTVHQGHEVGHQVKDALLGKVSGVSDVVVHIEPGEKT